MMNQERGPQRLHRGCIKRVLEDWLMREHQGKQQLHIQNPQALQPNHQNLQALKTANLHTIPDPIRTVYGRGTSSTTVTNTS
jgi:uncharacterized protein (DUF488 family)